MSQQQQYTSQSYSTTGNTQNLAGTYSGPNLTSAGGSNLAGSPGTRYSVQQPSTYTTTVNPSSPLRSGSVTYGTSTYSAQPYTSYTSTTAYPGTYSTGIYGTTQTSSNPYNDVWGGLKTSAIQEIKSNMQARDPTFGLDLRRYLDANVLSAADTARRQQAILETLQKYNLVSSNRLAEPKNLWQSGTYTAPSYTPGTYTSQTIYQTPERQSESVKQSRVLSGSIPGQLQSGGRVSALSPYRNSSYPEFELVEDLPDRSHLIDSINLFLQKSPMKEALLTSPNRVSIQRASVLSPAKISVESLLKEKYEDGSVYEGEGRAGVRHGRGKMIFKDGRVFEGDFNEGNTSGNGTFYYKAGRVAYEGGINNNLQYEGQGVQNSELPTPLVGGFDHRDFNKIGNSWTNYQGEFKGGKRHGNGTLTLSNGEKFVGEFRDDKIHGNGRFITQTGQAIEGNWQNGVFSQ